MSDEITLSFKVTVDTNDADYLTEINEISEDTLNMIKPLIDAIKAKTEEMKGKWFHNFENLNESGREEFDIRELYDFSEEVFDTFLELMPYGEYGFHSIESIEIAPLISWQKLL